MIKMTKNVLKKRREKDKETGEKENQTRSVRKKEIAVPGQDTSYNCWRCFEKIS